RGALVHHNVTSALAAEALAIRTAFQTESFLNVTHLRMFSDNQTLIRAINDKFFEKEIYGILKYIESSSSRFVKLSFFYLSRAENGQADALAKFIFRNPNNIDTILTQLCEIRAYESSNPIATTGSRRQAPEARDHKSQKRALLRHLDSHS
ncbi:unnamed protein product, partial [Brassica oleracea]